MANNTERTCRGPGKAGAGCHRDGDSARKALMPPDFGGMDTIITDVSA